MTYVSSPRFIIVLLAGMVLSACVAEQKETLVLSAKSPVHLRAIQSRVFETGDKNKILKAVISMLQDLGYSVVKVEPEAGTVSANKLRLLRLTAAVYPRSDSRTIVRANAVVKIDPTFLEETQIDAAEFYQQRFFEPLAKSIFLTALQIEDPKDETIRDIKMDLPPKKEKKEDPKKIDSSAEDEKAR